MLGKMYEETQMFKKMSHTHMIPSGTHKQKIQTDAKKPFQVILQVPFCAVFYSQRLQIQK